MSATKNKVDGVINKYGSNVTIVTKTISGTLDAWGEPVISSTSSSTIKAVKDQNVIKQLARQSAGRVKGASASLIVKSDVNELHGSLLTVKIILCSVYNHLK